jgi:hypothetical protein
MFLQWRWIGELAWLVLQAIGKVLNWDPPGDDPPDWFVARSKERWFQVCFWSLVALAVLLVLGFFVGLPGWIIYTFTTSLNPSADASAILVWPAAMGFGVLLLLGWAWREHRIGGRSRTATALVARAEKGDVRAAFDLALAYRRGARGLDRDGLAARVWLLRAAEGGHPEAMLLLAEMLRSGEGGLPDPAVARAWLQRAAESGSAEAARRLAEPDTDLH